MDSRIDTLPKRSSENLPQLQHDTVPSLSSPDSPGWLDLWQPTDRAPVPMADIEEDLERFEDLTAPATPEQISAVLAFAVTLLGAPADYEVRMPLYHSLLADIPVDLLAYGMWVACRDRAGLNERTPTFPRVSQIREPIVEELSRRNHVKRRLGAALSFSRLAERHRRAS